MLSGWFGSSTDASAYTYPDLPSPVTDEDFLKLAEEKRARLLLLAEEKEGWTPVDFITDGVRSDVLVWSKPDAESPIEIVKAQGNVNCDPKNFFSVVVLDDTEKRKQWDNELIEIKHLRTISENLKLYWTSYNAPYPVTQRCFITITWFVAPTEREAGIALSTSVNYSDYKEESGFVRGCSRLSGWIIQPFENSPNTCRITRIIQLDPKGWIPAMIINSMKTKPGLHITNLRKFLTN